MLMDKVVIDRKSNAAATTKIHYAFDNGKQTPQTIGRLLAFTFIPIQTKFSVSQNNYSISGARPPVVGFK